MFRPETGQVVLFGQVMALRKVFREVFTFWITEHNISCRKTMLSLYGKVYSLVWKNRLLP